MALADAAATASKIASPIWRSKLQASLVSNKNLVYSRYVQLATVKADGRPANRTVVFRGFLGDSDDALTFVTDSRSRKIQEVACNPAAEVAWYFPETREQYRIAGNLTIVDAAAGDSALQAARIRAWSALSDAGRQQFGWPQPGLPRAQQDPTAWSGAAPGPQDPPLDTFCLMVLRPEEVEQVLLLSNERYRYVRQELQESGSTVSWSEESINP
ncbi:hypothetical protein Agub_g12283 [Astrephomene gubernaculifera]|uniref:Pyridoxamine 5'-phosphate oxidase Alr4036 family FMN-binding domain-containing protein n=1 Tax=Astrephomene gubernaculifera TaxID=47775 RepID=A0AAD3E2G8_9CHLO|nr:hypothetical protein Agub_g12283 [Astrephomene gubernaculifera]